MAFNSHPIWFLIKEHGVTGLLRKRTASVYDAATGTVTTTNQDTSVKMYSYKISNTLSESSIEDGVQMFALLAKATNGTDTPEPDTDDQIQFMGKTFDVVKSDKIYSGNNVLVYMAQVKD